MHWNKWLLKNIINMMNPLYIILAVIALFSFLMLLAIFVANLSDNFIDKKPERIEIDIFYKYEDCERPFVALKETCQHKGEKSLVCEWSACGCEIMNTHCDDCGKLLIDGEIEC
jgi:hypothetical protein